MIGFIPQSAPPRHLSHKLPLGSELTMKVFMAMGAMGAITPHLQEGSAVMSRQEIEEVIAHYEQMFGMSSEEFLQRAKDGIAPDTFETMDWMILLRHR